MRPSRVTHLVLADVCQQQGRLDLALQVYNDMRSAGESKGGKGEQARGAVRLEPRQPLRQSAAHASDSGPSSPRGFVP